MRNTDFYLPSAYGYILLPFIVFALGWMKLYYAIPAVVCVLFCFYKMLKYLPEHWNFKWNSEDKERFLIAAVLIFVWVCISGIGGIAFQNDDHVWRNAMFETLVYEKWPVVREVTVDGELVSRGFSYYMGFWMLPALVGKIFGIKAGYYFQIIWAFYGILLFYYGICVIRKKIEVWPLIVFIFFSGMDILGYYVSGMDLAALSSTEHLEWWTKFQFSSMTTQLFWVFNQAIPAWLITVLLYLQKNNRHIGAILASALLNCTMPFVGMIPLCLYWLFTRTYAGVNSKADWRKAWIRDTFTIENILGGGMIGILSYLYLIKQGSSETSMFLNLKNGGWLVCLVFLLVEIGGICAVVYKYQKKNPLFYIIILWLCLCPLINAYGGKNFCMRASIPALLMLFIFILHALENTWKKREKLHLLAIFAVLLIGAVTPMHEFVRTFTETERIYLSNTEFVRVESVGIEAVMTNDYESTDVEKSFFYQYVAK